LIEVEAGDTTSSTYGIACDIGTTTVVASLLDLTGGVPVAVASTLNRQAAFGADVISRISALVEQPAALARLGDLMHETLAELTKEICAEAGIPPDRVYAVSCAGNTTMTEVLLGIDPTPIGSSPFIPAASEYPSVLASDIGMSVHPEARAYCFPRLGAYVGGDIVAGALATGMDRDSRLRLFIDVETNCKLVLARGDRMISTAAPVGPAFEVASIRCGMRAAPGAVEGVRLRDDVEIEVIGVGRPTGLCGSGLIDVVAELVRIGMINSSGRLGQPQDSSAVSTALLSRIGEIAGERAFLLGESDDGTPVYLTQKDVRELQFAKGAISTARRILAEELDVDPRHIDQVLLAGSFGSYINTRSAIRIGLVPKVPVDHVTSAGNVAGEGAKMTLLSGPERHGASSLVHAITYIEPSDRPDFNERFVDALSFDT
jgi:uncharacterized 2Fe-2S/4Fe-4S cluster protein (DUF4445 family)